MTTHAQISGMSCMHCVAAVQQALTKLPSIRVKEVAIGSVVFEGKIDQDSGEAIRSAIENEGYSVTAFQERSD